MTRGHAINHDVAAQIMIKPPAGFTVGTRHPTVKNVSNVLPFDKTFSRRIHILLWGIL